MGQPAARLGDPTVHGGVITVGIPNVLIGGAPAATLSHMHVCPMVNPGPVPHVGGPISKGSMGVFIGGMPAARLGDMAVCTGPPDSIAMGCPTVLIGEMGGGAGGGGGGGGGAGAGGGGGSAGVSGSGTSRDVTSAGGGGASGADQGKAVATSGGDPPQNQSEETHWVEYKFVDKAGNPVSGVPFVYTNSDGKVSKGKLSPSGSIKRSSIPAGNTEVELSAITSAAWSVKEARTGEEVQLVAETAGIESGTPAKIRVFERDVNSSDDLVCELDAVVQGDRVETTWEYKYSEEDEAELESDDEPLQYSDPEYYFTVEAHGCVGKSETLRYKDWVEFELVDEFDDPVPDEPYIVYFANGRILRGKLDTSGKARIEDVSRGQYRVVFENLPEVWISPE